MPGFRNLLASLQEVQEGLKTFAESVETQSASIGPKLDELTNKADQFHHRAEGLKEDRANAKRELDELDRLLAQSTKTQNDFSSQLEIDMEQVRLGSLDIRDFIQQWGDAVIATTDGFRTIREQFSGADLGKYRQEIQDLIAAINSGGAELGDVINYLKENVPTLAKGLIDVLDLFKQGKATLEEVQEVIAATKQAFPGLEGDALADAINQALLGGTL